MSATRDESWIATVLQTGGCCAGLYVEHTPRVWYGNEEREKMMNDDGLIGFRVTRMT